MDNQNNLLETPEEFLKNLSKSIKDNPAINESLANILIDNILKVDPDKDSTARALLRLNELAESRVNLSALENHNG
jgi:hypothetical protein